MAHPVVQLLVNPAAGAWSRRRIAALRTAFETAGARVILSTSEQDAPVIADDVDHVCAVGGDGTLRHVAAAVARTGRPLTMSIYPAGTVNLIGRECGYARDPVAFVSRALADSSPRRHYFGLIGDAMLFGCASVGPDSAAVARLSPRLKRVIGRAAYVVAFLGILRRWPRPQLQIIAGNREIACEAVYIAKGRFFAGPWSFAPGAAVDRPLLHVVALTRATRLDFLGFVWSLWRGQGLAGRAGVVGFTCTAMTLDGADVQAVQADGDIVAHLPVRIVLSPQTLAFV